VIRCDRCGGGGVKLAPSWEACAACTLCGGRGIISFGELSNLLREHESTLRGVEDPRHKTRRFTAMRILNKLTEVLAR